MRRAVRWLSAAVWAAALTCVHETARAQAELQPIQFPVGNFRPAASTMAYWVTEEAKPRGHLTLDGQVLFNYESRPLVLVDTADDTRQADIIKSRLNADLLFAVGFWDRLELGLALPVTFLQEEEELQYLDREQGGDLSGGLGDLRFVPKVLLATSENETTRFSLAVPVTFPTGNEEAMLGDANFTASPMFLISFNTDVIDIGVNLGVRIREKQGFAFTDTQDNVAVGSELIGSIGPKIHVLKDRLDLVADLWGSTAFEEQDEEEFPLEALGGLRFYFADGIVANAGAGGGLTRGIGAPAFRIVAGIGYEFKEDPDPDKDGILGDDDMCPLRPEDQDGFEDANGCPDPDNDQDAIQDVKDKCPLVPEDHDGFEDEDGCPDQDNDRDRILDVDDKCPDDPEDVDKFEDGDGCPDQDNDQDGVLDPDDKCPVEPEDRDTYQDDDGCPDPDNDQDRILDQDDKCPLEPEDQDNFEDTDGCPDPDNDQDGILDARDNCPLEPELFNGYQDDDGCPDTPKKKGPVEIERGKIVAPPVFFATNDDVILEKSFPTLELVAQTFKDNPWVKKVRVEGHTDSRGSDEHNLDLSKRRAASVMKFLIQAGVAPERLESQGYGEEHPIASNDTALGRAKNRRVEFIIIEPPMKQHETRGGDAAP